MEVRLLGENRGRLAAQPPNRHFPNCALRSSTQQSGVEDEAAAHDGAGDEGSSGGEHQVGGEGRAAGLVQVAQALYSRCGALERRAVQRSHL